jgi:GNAT superfamily N-acetyltransferase
MLGPATVTIRNAEVDDAAAVAQLMAQLGYPTTGAAMANRLTRLGSHPDYQTFVAEIGNTVVGLVGVYLGHALEFNQPYGRLTGLVVDEAHRGQGIGRRLLNRAEEWLKQRGVEMLTLTSGNHRNEAHRFYSHVGYEQTGLRFIKRL